MTDSNLGGVEEGLVEGSEAAGATALTDCVTDDAGTLGGSLVGDTGHAVLKKRGSALRVRRDRRVQVERLFHAARRGRQRNATGREDLPECSIEELEHFRPVAMSLSWST